MTLRFLRVDKTNDDDEDGLKFGASGETRTRTSLRTADFESAASTIPPPRH